MTTSALPTSGMPPTTSCSLSLYCGEEAIQSLGFDGLDQVVVEAGFLGQHPVLLVPPSGQGDEDRAVLAALGEDATRGLVAVQLRHRDVQKDDVGQKRSRDPHRLVPVVRGAHVMPLHL